MENSLEMWLNDILKDAGVDARSSCWQYPPIYDPVKKEIMLVYLNRWDRMKRWVVRKILAWSLNNA